jgi:hypothetical protein
MVVGAAAGCDLLISKARSIDRSLVALDSSYRGRAGIVTKYAKSVYQNPVCLPRARLPKIHLANKATAINNVTAPTKAVNPALQVTHQILKLHTQP